MKVPTYVFRAGVAGAGGCAAARNPGQTIDGQADYFTAVASAGSVY
jgi:hypothetical protein